MRLLAAALIVTILAWKETEAFTSTRPSRRTVSTQCYAKLEGRTIKGEFKPINNFLLVKKAEAKDQTEGGILLSGKAKIVKTEGQVVSVGPGKTHPDSGKVMEVPVAPGDSVVYGKYDGTEIDYDGAPHTLIRDDDILVKFSGGELSMDTVDVVRDYVLVKINTKEEETTGGILIAKSSTREAKPSTGEVVKVGPGRMASDGSLMPMDVEVGDMVKFRDFAGNEVEIGDDDFAVVNVADILAKF
jgi:chaperonin GroES